MQNNIVLQVDCHGGFKELRYRAIVYICLSHCANITCFCQKKHTHTQRSQRESGASYVVLIAKKERKKKFRHYFWSVDIYFCRHGHQIS